MVNYVRTWRALDSGYSHRSEDTEGSSTTLVTYRFHTSANLPDVTDLSYYATSVYALSASDRATFRSALDQIEAVSNIRFVETTEEANINVNGVRGSAWGGWANYPTTTGNMSLEDLSIRTMLHEIGHSLGLKHPFEGDVQLATDLDRQSVTLMSYTFESHTINKLGYLDVDALENLYGTPSSSGNWNVFVQDGVLYVDGTDGSDRFNAENSPLSVNAGGGADYVVGSWHADTMNGGNGNDRLIGGWGNDDLNGGAGADTIRGGYGADTIHGGDGNDRLFGGEYGDTIRGGAGKDIVNGENGFDDLYGDAGDDTLDGGFGWDTLQGGGGNDLLSGGADRDILNGGSGHDVLRGGSGNDDLNGDGGRDSLYGASGRDYLYGGAGNDLLKGGGGPDYMYGEGGADRMFGGLGTDYLDGGDGDDRISGRRGADTLYGGEGNDTLNGGKGGDYLRGNDWSESGTYGADVFQMIGSFGNDTIGDFDEGLDRVEVSEDYLNGYVNARAYLDANSETVDYWNTVVQFGSNSVTFSYVTDIADLYDSFDFV